MTITSSSGVGKVVPPKVPNPPIGTVTGAPSAAPMPSTMPSRPPSAGTAPPLRPPKPPQPRNPVVTANKGPTPQDTLQRLSSKPAIPGNPQPRTPTPVRPAASSGSVKPVQRVVKASELTAEAIFQRLHWFENAYKVHVAHIKDLVGRLNRTGTAAPALPHIEPLKSAAGDIDPNVG